MRVDFKTYETILRMNKIVKGKHWWELSGDSKYWMDTSDTFQHVDRHYKKPLKKRKYHRRKTYFVPYESHRKIGVDYLPF